MSKLLSFIAAIIFFISINANAALGSSQPTGTTQKPLSVTGTLTVERSAKELARNAEADKEKSTIDHDTVHYLALTTDFTGVLALIAIGQAFLFLWQLKLMQQSTRDAADAAQAARTSAQVALDTFTHLERPWIFLEKFRVVRREGAPIQPQLLNNFFISLVFKNNGRSPAFIDTLEFQFIEKNALPAVPNYTSCTSRLRCSSTLSSEAEFESSQVGPAPGTDVEYTMFGRLIYRDMAGTKHHTGFAIDISPNLPAASTNANELYDNHD